METHTFIYPSEIRSPLDDLGLRIIQALESRAYSVPGFSVSFREQRREEALVRYVSDVLGPGFSLRFGRHGADFTNPANLEHVAAANVFLTFFNDSSGPSLATYHGVDWEEHAHAHFGYGTMPKGTVGYEQRTEEYGFHWPERLMQDSALFDQCTVPMPDSHYVSDRFSVAPFSDAVKEVSASALMSQVYDWLETHVLQAILSEPEAYLMPGAFEESDVEWPQELGYLYSLASPWERSKMQNGIEGGRFTTVVLDSGAPRRTYSRNTGYQRQWALSPVPPTAPIDEIMASLPDHDPSEGRISSAIRIEGEALMPDVSLVCVKPSKANGIFIVDGPDVWGEKLIAKRATGWKPVWVAPSEYQNGRFEIPFAMPLREISPEEVTFLDGHFINQREWQD